MFACNVKRKRSVEAVVPPETRERLRDVLFREFEASSELVELLLRLPRGVETTSAVFWKGTVYVGVTYGGEQVVWKFRPSSVRSVPVPSFELRVAVRLYFNAMEGRDDPKREETGVDLDCYAQTLGDTIRDEIMAETDPERDEPPFLVVTVADQCFLLTREKVIGCFNADSILLV